MRFGSLALCLAILAGCESAPKSPAAPSTPAAPAAPSVKAPEKPAAPAPPQAPPPAPKAEAPAAKAAPPASSPDPKAEAKPVTAELSKFKGPAEAAELFGYDDGNGRIFMYTAGTVEIPVKLTADAVYEIVVNVSCDEAMGQKAKFTVAVDGQKIGEEISCTTADDKAYTLKASLKAGDRKIAVSFLNDLYKENEYDLNMYVSGLKLNPAK